MRWFWIGSIATLMGAAAFWLRETARSPVGAEILSAVGRNSVAPPPQLERPSGSASFSSNAKTGTPTANALPRNEDRPSSRPRIDELIFNASSLVKAKRLEDAINLLKEHVPSHAQDDRLFEELAILTMRAGKAEDSERWLRKTLEVNPRNPVALGELVSLLEQAGRAEDTVTILQEILTTCSDCADARLALGSLFLKAGATDDAIWELRKAAEHSSVKEVALRQLFSAFTQNGDRESAISTLKEIVTLFETHVTELKQHGAAVGILEDSLKKDRVTLHSLQNQEKDG